MALSKSLRLIPGPDAQNGLHPRSYRRINLTDDIGNEKDLACPQSQCRGDPAIALRILL